MGNNENIREKPSGENNSQQNSTQSSQDKPQSYGTVSVQKELNRSKPISYGTVSRSYTEDTKNNVTIEKPLKEDN
ncbi:MAG: hypothetical protein DWB56_00390 [Candidatus Jettenia sp.]|uniref:Uncharacterized protein n=1 Tax=Candidatus Jettenia caeni TaxID=247490 RepID=I3ILH0_9BACT|nr:hypothetical protein [Candidatus Jettenia sp. AMX1]MBC6927411.1 hypothetical protein [Candidatus Jettenia sp.]GAB62565.1 hypothetical protein KSU1_C0969 [Candidatus Jettenia caeni]KAA0251786.1 MAG: hypothetical protein EDM77_00395 [Candidatus Jettenia sp. AMX1]MCE7879095.1 hypothetical protein [Candidatus Jettenia sp. AMX1]MCQ3925841.1 hypothetical protein [Candidatus Jettenia sp.]